MKPEYLYQLKAAKQVLANALDDSYLASVLAACPGSGKTTISHIIINSYLEMFPQANVVVLTEGQNLLRLQYLSELQSAHVPINFTFGGFGSNTQCQVGIPQSIHKLSLSKIDLLIVDECHHFYMQNTDQKIIHQFRPTHQIIMTGSPAKFNLHNESTYGKKYGMYYIAGEELEDLGVFSKVTLDMLKVTDKSSPVSTIQQILNQLKDKDISKAIIACPTIRYCRMVGDYLKSTGRNDIFVSTSVSDQDNTVIESFKNRQTGLLLVVNKGILGFNDCQVVTLIDIKASSNVDSSYQLLARVMRKHPENKPKNYIRIYDKNHNTQVENIHKLCALMRRDIFKGFTGKNLKITYRFDY